MNERMTEQLAMRVDKWLANEYSFPAVVSTLSFLLAFILSIYIFAALSVLGVWSDWRQDCLDDWMDGWMDGWIGLT